MSTPLSITSGLTASIQKKTRLFQNVFMIFFALFFIYNVYNIQLFTISVLPEIVGSNSSNFERNQPVLFTNITISNIQITLSLFLLSHQLFTTQSGSGSIIGLSVNQFTQLDSNKNYKNSKKNPVKKCQKLKNKENPENLSGKWRP